MTALSTASWVFLRLDGLVDALLDEDALQGPGVQLVQELPDLQLQLRLEDGQEPLGMVAHDLGDGHQRRLAVLDDEEVAGYGLLALREGVQRVYGLLRVHAAGELYLYLDLVRGEVADGGDLEPAALAAVSTLAMRLSVVTPKGRSRMTMRLGSERVQRRAHAHPARCRPRTPRRPTMPPVGKSGYSLKRLAAQAGDLGLEHLDRVVRQDLGAHADGDALGAGDQDHGHLGREDDGLPVAAVVAVLVLGDLGVVEDVLGEGRWPGTRCSGPPRPRRR